MAAFSLVHGAWHGSWAWDLLRRELEARGHAVAAPDLPCDDVGAGVEDYARLVPPADVVVGHSLGGLTIPLVEARLRVFLCALVPGADRDDAFVPQASATRASATSSGGRITPTRQTPCGSSSIRSRRPRSRGCYGRRHRSTR
jgi:Predicted esterase of the alpha/beta hydrolase fold